MSLARFAVRHPVPVNLLMIAIILAGIFLGLSLRREFFPESEPDMAQIVLPFPGATPREVEETLALKVEDKLAEFEEIKEIRTTLSEGGGGIIVEFQQNVRNVDKLITDIQRELDALRDLPDEAEKIQVQIIEPNIPVVRVALWGDADEAVMKQAIRDIRDDLRNLPGMGEIIVEGTRSFEIRIDVDHHELIARGISLPEVSDVVGQWMVEGPGGTIRGQAGNIKVRTLGVPERAKAIREIIVRALPDGTVVRLEDVAVITEGFVDEDVLTRFNGKPSVGLTVIKTGQQDIVHMADMVRGYVAARTGQPFEPRLRDYFTTTPRRIAWRLGRDTAQPLPPGISLGAHFDFARFVEQRLDLLLRNAGAGATLVFLTLLLFLNWRVALWVGVGLATAVLGTLVLMSWGDVTLNLLTMFGLIVVLGLLVDDAIVVSENIQTRHDKGEPPLEAAVNGTNQVLWPVVATVLTSVVAFLPLTFIQGRIGDLIGALPIVVACALLMSLIESLLILPSHMGHTLARRDRMQPGRMSRAIRRYEQWRDHIIFDVVVPWYGRFIRTALHFRYISAATAVMVLAISVGMVMGGRAKYTFMQESDAESIIVNLNMPVGTSIERTNRMVTRIEQAAHDQPETRSILAIVGQRSNLEMGNNEAFAQHVAQIFIELAEVEDRDRESAQVIESIRERLRDDLDEVDRLSFEELSGGPGGPGISIRVSGEDLDLIADAARDLKRLLAEYEGVHEIADDNDLGQIELQISLKPGAASLGFTTANVARQVRGFLFGLEAHVFADRQEDIKVRVRLAEQARRSMYTIENMWVHSPAGDMVPLSEIADVTQTVGYASIKRVDRKRATLVTADTSPGISPDAIVARMLRAEGDEPSAIARIQAQYPKLDITFVGRQRQQSEAFGSLPYGFLAAVVMIYVILAWLFNSYLQPLVVLSIIPFATIGVIWGHWLLGYEMTFLSLIGFVALSGIVVNDSLILVEFYNKRRAQGDSVPDALVSAGQARLRAIFLTTVTTFLGLTPLILEQSFQAKFLVPMAISIAVGLVAATVVILVVLPCFIVILYDLRAVAYFLWHGGSRQSQPPPDGLPAELEHA